MTERNDEVTKRVERNETQNDKKMIRNIFITIIIIIVLFKF